MTGSISVLALSAILALTFFLGVSSYSFWRIQREDRTPLWLSAWLFTSAVFALCRLLQYASLNPTFYNLVPRFLLTSVYILVWIGYEIANSFVGHQPNPRERTFIIVTLALPTILLWTGNSILTNQIMVREFTIGGSFTGVAVGKLYLVANLLLLGLGIIPLIRLIKSPSDHKKENLWMTGGFLFVIFFSLVDFITTSLNIHWLRLSDFSYLPVALFFSFIQIQRLGVLYRNMNQKVQEHTIELSQVNEILRTEIGERQQTQQALQESEARYRMLFMANPHPMWVYDLENLAFLLINDAAVAQYGFTWHEFLNMTIKDIRPNEEIPVLMENLAQERQPLEWSGPWKHRKKDGTIIHVEILSHEFDIYGKPARLVVANDITERLQAEEALRTSEYKFATAFRISPDSVNINRMSDGLYLEVNEGFTRLTGYTREDAIGKSSDDLGIWVDEADQTRLIEGLRKDGEVANLEAAFRLKNGQIKIGLMSARLIQINGDTCILSITRDISELKQAAEEISRKADVMTTLYEGTHDLVIYKSLSELLNTIVIRAAKLLNASGGGLYLCDTERRQVRCEVSHNTLRDYTGTILQYGEGAAGRVAETGQPLIIKDYRTWEGRAAVYEKDQPFSSMLSVPLCWQDQVIGVIHVLENNEPREFSEEDLQVLTLFANQAAIAVENSRLFDFEQRRRQEAAAIAEVGRDISASLQLSIVLERIASHAKELLQVETSAVYLAEPSQAVLRAIAAIGPDAEEIKHDPLKIGEGILGNIAVHQIGEIVNYSTADERGITIQGTENIPNEHLMGVPIVSRNNLSGLIAVWRTGEGLEFRKADLDFLSSLAQQAAIALENARLFEETRQRLAELEVLQTIASALRIAQDPDEALPIILNQLVSLLDITNSLVDLIDPENGDIVTVLAKGEWEAVSGKRIPATNSMSNRVIVSRQPFTVNNLADDWMSRHAFVTSAIHALACVPIMAQQQPIGALWVGRQRQKSITPEEVKLLVAIGEMVGNTIQRMKLHEQTVDQAEELALAYEMTLEGWAKALELHDKETAGHSYRVTDLTLQLSRKLGIPESQLMHIHRGVLLHDIGKMGIPDQLLKKTGPLTDDEWDIMRLHPQYAYDLLNPINYLRPALDIPYCHHERWDGSGYPRGLKGEQIPLPARIFAVVDVYDALSNDRPYRLAWNAEDVIQYISEESGKHFDPQVVEAFFQLMKVRQNG
jgi:PAS domain S-box-containing protein